MKLRCELLGHRYEQTFVDGFSFLPTDLYVISCVRCGKHLASYERLKETFRKRDLTRTARKP